jgi:hypothetical protein
MTMQRIEPILNHQSPTAMTRETVDTIRFSGFFMAGNHGGAARSELLV